MNKSIINFAVIVKDGVVQQIGKSYITQPAAVKKPEKGEPHGKRA